MLFIQPPLPRHRYYYYSLSQQPFLTATVVMNTATQCIGSRNSHFLPRCIFTNSIRSNVPGRGLQHCPQYHHSPSLQLSLITITLLLLLSPINTTILIWPTPVVTTTVGTNIQESLSLATAPVSFRIPLHSPSLGNKYCLPSCLYSSGMHVTDRIHSYVLITGNQ